MRCFAVKYSMNCSICKLITKYQTLFDIILDSKLHITSCSRYWKLFRYNENDYVYYLMNRFLSHSSSSNTYIRCQILQVFISFISIQNENYFWMSNFLDMSIVVIISRLITYNVLIKINLLSLLSKNWYFYIIMSL